MAGTMMSCPSQARRERDQDVDGTGALDDFGWEDIVGFLEVAGDTKMPEILIASVESKK